ncbi:hypothetical protein BAX97_07165 [Elizabethkingia meningoseptica]|nr:hypothetical protein BBD33_05850 [Elizabethkingia meningoseptica]EOR29562.1 hypothetical protein L100_10794 [Elizabethkingia meningoseptica ATCC 13253 = NBRC 12535]AQX46843.1 hypothetical protein B5G46_05845 [Elizabethkingia meningoseptica]KUY16228.1 hypothetical protein ATB99_09775 [Elizabethkingia meningoseptica]MDE5490668.1 hypothetical protein [Elizabethkingia meningoseptica]
MYFSELDYKILQSFIQGYVHALDNIFNTNINLSFTNWLYSQANQKSLIWNDYIFLILANEDPNKAFAITLQKWIEFSRIQSE